jgi:hypothetical protein
LSRICSDVAGLWAALKRASLGHPDKLVPVDILYFLEGRLALVERFYDAAARPFENTKRQIEVGEEPFAPRRAPEEYDGPEYEIEWNEAGDCLRLLGQCCLSLVQKSLLDYMRAFVMRESSVARMDQVGSALRPYQKKDGLFNCYCRFLEARTQLDWTKSPVSRDRIEQINLCRNDILHNEDIDGTWPQQSEGHFNKYPISIFADEMELAIYDGNPESPTSINITRDKLTAAIDDVQQLCGFVETHRTR